MQTAQTIDAMFDVQSACLTMQDGENLFVPREVFSRFPQAMLPDLIHDWAVENHYLESSDSVAVISVR